LVNPQSISLAFSPSLQTIWQILNSKLVLLVIGFALTTALGAALSSWLQTASWKRQTRVDLFRKRYEEGTTFLDDLSDRIGGRAFALQRLLWSLTDTADEKRRATEEEYFRIVTEWNASSRTCRNKIRLLIGEEQSDRFLDYQDTTRPENPRSLHYIFVKAHNEVLAAKHEQNAAAHAQECVTELNWACSVFLEDLTTAFLERATSLQLLEIPELRPSKPRNTPDMKR
jgi:hypothetical protein